VKVAVRARATTTVQQAARTQADAAPAAVTALTPAAYNLGVSIGWKSFALSGDVAKVQGGAIPGGREAAGNRPQLQSEEVHRPGRGRSGAQRADDAQDRAAG
jgi:hypothetical protein